MQVLNPSFDFQAFLKRVASAAERVLMLDYDGTLAPFRVNPAEAAPYPGVTEAIDEIVRAGGTRVVVVSGRPAQELPPLLGTFRAPEIWGGHGWERLRPDGPLDVHEPDAETRRALVDALETARRFVAAGARLEGKRASIALHWRGLPEATAANLGRDAMEAWSPLAHAGKVEILPFDGGLELRARGCNKEFAVNEILHETGGDCAIAYLGDDTTDEDAFRAVKARGAAVLVRTQARDSCADVWLKPPEELLEFMCHWRVEKR